MLKVFPFITISFILIIGQICLNRPIIFCNRISNKITFFYSNKYFLAYSIAKNNRSIYKISVNNQNKGKCDKKKYF